MSHALQVSFRHLAPSEGVVALAASRYRQLRCVLDGPAECMVSVEADQHARRPLAHAVVTIHERGKARAAASASHRNPETALGIALDDVRAQLGAPRSLVEVAREGSALYEG